MLVDIKIKHKVTQKVLFKGYTNNLQGANLQGAYLQDANLRDADLLDADLRDANLQNANLRDANLQNANLWGADLRCANLQGVNLQDANLWDANLLDADLRDANLQNANLRGANLLDANLWGANLPPFFTCPQEGAFIAWKKIKNKLLKLRIPAKAKRTSSLVGRKNRAEYCVILGIYTLDGKNTKLRCIKGGYNNDTYTVGSKFYPDKYDPDIRVECTNGVHFFITKEEAINY